MKLILGLGQTGLSCIRYLAKQNISMIVMDTRSNPPGLSTLQAEFPDIPVHLGDFDLSLIQQAEEIIASPGLEIPTAVTALNIPIIGDIELFARVAQAPIVGITGTNAKGTVTTLVSDMIRQAGLQVCVGGNIGTPVLDLLAEPVPDFYVLEISSFQLETTYSLTTAAATILNISEDHLDRHKTMAAYIAAKQRIYQGCEVKVWNRDDENIYPPRRFAPPLQGGDLSFGFSEPQPNQFGLRQLNHQTYLAYGDQNLLSVDDLFIKGKHNWINALAALALGTAIHLPIPAMLEALRNFKGLEHRCEWVAYHQGITWYNDSKGTNVGATLAAIAGLGSALKGKLILIAGGVGKGADFTPLRESITQHVRSIVLIGRDAHLLEQAFKDTVPMQHAVDLAAAVQLAKQQAQVEDAVLLSPACASLDMFRNFEERGEIFKKLVRGLCV